MTDELYNKLMRIFNQDTPLAYFRSVHGAMIPCKVLEIREGLDQYQYKFTRIVAKITSNKYQSEGYKRGDIINSSVNWIIPRSCWKYHTILSYTWKDKLNGFYTSLREAKQ